MTNLIDEERVLILVKTYPTLSAKYVETVCTAGIREDGSWVRIYPIKFRHLEKDQRFSKYQWVGLEITRDKQDPRPESYKLLGAIKPLEKIDTSNLWELRKNLVLKNTETDLSRLISEARNTEQYKSLALFKPKKILKFLIKIETQTLEQKNKRKALEKQIGKDKAKILAQKVPYKFYYTISDENGKRSTMQIVDWEIYQLCRKLIRKYGQKKHIIYKHLKEKYFDEFITNREVYLFLGTNKIWHMRRSKNPFMIIGVFYPPKP